MASEKTLGYKLIFKSLGTGICIILIIGSWLTMAEVLQGFEDVYDRHFFEVYFVHSFNSIFYVVWKFWLVFPGGLSCNSAGVGTLDNFKKLVLAAVFLTAVGFASDIFWYASLTMTRISANTAIYQSVPALVFILSIPVLKERITLTKLLSVAFTIVGVCLVSLFRTNTLKEEEKFNSTMSATSHEEDEEFEAPLGYVFVAISVFFYAVYETFYKRLATREDDTAPVWNTTRVLGYTGIIDLFLFWPLLIIAHFSGLEPFELPPTLDIFYELVAVAALDIVFNLALVICITISTPLFASVASILTIPVAVLLDWWLKDFILSWQALVGVGTILTGFVGLVASEIWETRKKAKQSGEESEEKETLIKESPKISKASIKMKLKSVRVATINSLTWNNIKSVLLDHII